MADKALQRDLSLSKPAFRASREVRDAMIQDADFTRKSLCVTAKKLIKEKRDTHLDSLQTLEKQGHKSRCSMLVSGQGKGIGWC